MTEKEILNHRGKAFILGEWWSGTLCHYFNKYSKFYVLHLIGGKHSLSVYGNYIKIMPSLVILGNRN